MKIKPLASSSEGNSTHIFTDDASILIDAGISAKKAFEAAGTEHFDAIFITHEHGDHIKGLGPIGRKTGAEIFMHELVYKKIADKLNKCNVTVLQPGQVIQVKDLEIDNFSTRHDSVYSYGYIVSEGDKKFGYLTDTGSWTKLMGNKLKGCDAYLIEADYDADTLANYEDYDPFLKERIASNWGHLSNDQTMELIKYLDIEDPNFIIFAHLSPRTNTPEMVLQAAADCFPDWDQDVFHIAPLETELEL